MEQLGAEQYGLSEAEQNLSNLLESACEKLYPTNGYMLHLQGLTPDVMTLMELEVYNGVPLDTEKGADITLAYDSIAQELRLKKLVHPLDKKPNSALIIQSTANHVDGLQYIPILENSNGQEFSPASSVLGEPLKNKKIAKILNGYGIRNIPHPSEDQYDLWRANLLSNCKAGWQLFEEVEIVVGMQDSTVDTVKIGIHEEYQEGVKVSREKYLTSVHTSFDSSGERMMQNMFKIMQLDSDYGRAVHASDETVVKTLNPHVINDETVIAHQVQALPLISPGIEMFETLLKDASAYLTESKDY